MTDNEDKKINSNVLIDNEYIHVEIPTNVLPENKYIYIKTDVLPSGEEIYIITSKVSHKWVAFSTNYDAFLNAHKILDAIENAEMINENHPGKFKINKYLGLLIEDIAEQELIKRENNE